MCLGPLQDSDLYCGMCAWLQKDRSKGKGVKETFAEISPKLLASINALYVYACTGQGKTAMKGNAAARTCIRLAVRDKDYLFTAADSAKFDALVAMSEVRSHPQGHHNCWSLQ